LEFLHEGHVIIAPQHPVMDVCADADKSVYFCCGGEQQLPGVPLLLFRGHHRPMVLESPQQGRTMRCT
jgi:hypothetical protein